MANLSITVHHKRQIHEDVTFKMKHFSAIVAESSNLNVAELLFPTLHYNKSVL